jgi:hypothetical protein
VRAAGGLIGVLLLLGTLLLGGLQRNGSRFYAIMCLASVLPLSFLRRFSLACKEMEAGLNIMFLQYYVGAAAFLSAPFNGPFDGLQKSHKRTG